MGDLARDRVGEHWVLGAGRAQPGARAEDDLVRVGVRVRG